MADRNERLIRIQGLAGKLETNDSQVVDMMRLMVQDNLKAMAYGGSGGNGISDPTPGGAFTTRTVVDSFGRTREVVSWRDHRPEDDLAAYETNLKAAEKALDEADAIRRRYMSANMDIRNRLDPTDFCHIHFALHLYEGHRRVSGNLCKLCHGFMYGDEKAGQPAMGREPTATEADYWHRHGHWPYVPIDPKARSLK